MSKKRLLLLASALLAVVLSMSGCGNKPPVDGPEEQKSHTLIFYMVGGRQSSEDLMAYHIKENITTIRGSVNKYFPDYGKVFIYYHGYGSQIGSEECTLWQVMRPEGIEIAELRVVEEWDPATTPRNSTSSDVIKSVIDKVKSEAGTESYAISFSGHSTAWFPAEITPPGSRTGVPATEHDFSQGGAFTRAFGPNPKTNEWGSIGDIVEGLKGTPMEYIMFDMCFMSSIEVLYDLRHSAKYILASPTEILFNGFPYHKIMPLLFSDKNDDTEVRLNNASKAIVDYYTSGAGGNGDLGYDEDLWSATISVIDSSAIDAVADAVKRILAKGGTIDEGRIGEPEYIQYLELMPGHAFFDFRDYYDKFVDEEGLSILLEAAVMEMVDENHTSFIYSGYGETGRVPLERFCGVSSYIPRAAYPMTAEAYRNTAWAKAILPQ